MHVGALEARNWAGLVFTDGPDDGIAVRLAFTTPAGDRRHHGDWYWLVSRVGTHAPDGSYARVEFDLDAEPSPSSAPAAGTLILEWSRRADAVALSATVTAPGRLELVGDAPWGWSARWVEVVGDERAEMAGEAGDPGADGWRAALETREIAAVFSAGTVSRDETATAPCDQAGSAQGSGAMPEPGDDVHPARTLDVAPGATGRVAMVAAWGGDPLARAHKLLPDADTWIDEARTEWARRGLRATTRPGQGAAVSAKARSSLAGPPRATHSELLESIADNLMWTVLLQPETGRLYTPAGRRWIFPRPTGRHRAPKPRGPGSGPGTQSGSAATSDLSPHLPEPDDWTIFGWDTFFNALLLANVSGELAWSTLLAGVEARYPNGNIPNWRSRRGGTPDRSQPPVGSFAALKLYGIHPDRDALAAAWPGLLAWSDWWVADKNGRPRREGLTPGLLSWGSDTALVPGPEQVPEWEVGASGHQRAAWESGQDDLPLWDEAKWDAEREVLAMSAVDLCSYRALDLECLARIARILGDEAAARRLDASRQRLAETMNRTLWSEAAGLYLDELPSGRSPRVAASHFLPLLAGIPSRQRARRMVDVLRDPARFWGDWVLPTISRDDPAFGDQQYWRGSIWPPMNYLVLQGLRRYGFDDLAAELAWKGADMFLADRRRTGFCRENFDSRTGRGHGRRFQSWGPLFALGALEELGIDAGAGGINPAPPPAPPPPRRSAPR